MPSFSGRVLAAPILKDLIYNPSNSENSRAELILERLFKLGKSEGWDAKCHSYYFLLKLATTRMAKENSIAFDSMRSVYRDYPIFRKVLKRTLKLFLRSVEEYGVTMPQKMSAPLLVEFELTNRCNLRCKHCYASAGKSFANELSTREIKSILGQINKEGVPIVCFTGGEPMLRRDFFEILAHAKKIGLAVVLTTNGTLITKEKARRLKRLGVDYVRISLDGATPKTHDWLRGVHGSFGRAVKGIRNCVGAGVKTGIGTVILQENIHELGDIIDLVAGLGCCDINAIPLIESGRAKLAAKKEMHEPTPEQKMMNEKLIGAKARKYEGRMLLNFLDLDHIRKAKGISQKLVGWAYGGCVGGRSVCVIGPSGDVRPCITMWITVGNLRKQSLAGIWKGSHVLEQLKDRSLLKGKCGSCEFKYSCGGCRSAAYEKHGDYLESDPGCYMRII